MAATSLFREVETVIMWLLKQQAAIDELSIKHYDAVTKADSDCIVVKGDQGEPMLEGNKPFSGTVEIQFRSDIHIPERSDAIYKSIRAALNPPANHPVEGIVKFSWLNLMTEQITDDRNSKKNLRMWKVTLPVQAKAA